MKSIGTKRHERLVELLVAERKAHGLRQSGLARALRERQTWVSRIEGGDRRVDVIEFLDLAEAIGFDPLVALGTILEVERDKPLRPPEGATKQHRRDTRRSRSSRPSSHR